MRVDDSTRDAGRIGGELRSERHESGFGGGAGAAPGGREADQGMGVGGDEGAEGGGAVDGVEHGVVGRVEPLRLCRTALSFGHLGYSTLFTAYY